MRGRGRGGRGRGRDDYGVPRIGPVTEEVPAYPPNPRLTKSDPQLDSSQQNLVALNRILINYWKFQSPFYIRERVDTPAVETFSESQRQSAFFDPTTQKDLIVNLSGGQYFPEELLKDHYSPPTRRRGPRLVQSKKTEAEGTSGATGTDLFNDEEGAPEEQDDFGGDDYAHDHYADEDRDDDDGGGGGDDDGVF